MRKLLLVPVLLILVILTSGCVSDVTVISDNEIADCLSFTVENCPDQCVMCPPCEVCSSIRCNTEEFCSSIGFERDWYNITKPADEDTPEVGEEEGPPTIFDIGIGLAPWDPQTNFAGDVDFSGLQYSEKIFIEFGGDMGDGTRNVHPMFVLPLGTEIHAVSDGIVSHLTSLGDDDYDLCVVRYAGDPWCISYEHIKSPTVREGDTVKVGQVLGEAGRINEFTESGKFDLKIWKGGTDIINHCPYDLLDESVKSGIHARMNTLISEWEDYIGKDVYDEDLWIAPGCAERTLMEFPSE